MYLKSLELQGFKSFPDKIKLEFGKGLTAVVGPNGSGKSNIGDAVRWVLGEQSSKTLRGAKMEDVIFAGTQFRKSVGFAQVTLNIDNSKGVLQIPSDEVSVTRKLYRSGESEYLINGAQVRLKDIAELFMDTGLGRDGYSIIGQGRVAEIVSAKSNERREIFEEAAGISKFRYKKEEAERRLAAAQDNILRLNDILGELEGRVEPLRIQSEKAAKFLELSEEKKSLEVSVWMRKLDEMRASLKEIEDKVLIHNTEYENLDSDIQALEDKIQESYRHMQESTARVDGLQNKILETERVNGQISADIAVYKNDIEHAREAISGIEEQKKNAEISAADLTDKVAEQRKKSEEILLHQQETEKSLNDVHTKLDNLTAETSGFNDSFESANALLNQLYVKQSEYKFTIQSAQTNSKELSEQAEMGKQQEQALRDSVNDGQKELEQVRRGLSELDEKLSEQQNKIQGYNRLFQSKAEKLSAAKSSYDKALMQLREKQQRIQLLSDLENNMEGFAHSVKEIIKAGKNSRISGIKGTVAQLIKVDGQYGTAIETALGAALQNVVVENEETAKRCIRLLKEQNAGRATFLPITSVKGNILQERDLENQNGFIALASELVEYDSQYEGIIRSLLGRIAVAEDIDTATLLSKKYGYKFRVVTLDGQVINAGGSFTGGSAVRSGGVLTRKNEIDDLTSEAEKLSAQLEELKSNSAKLQAETDKLGFDIEGIKEQISIINEDKIRFSSEGRRLEDSLRQTNSQLETVVLQVLRFQERAKEQENAYNSAVTGLADCEKQISEKEKFLSETQGKKDTLHRQREELSAQLSELKLKQVELQKDYEASEQTIAHLMETSGSIADSAALFSKQISEQEELISRKEQLISERKKQLEQSGEAVAALQESIKAEQQNHRTLEQKATELRTELKTQNDVKEKFSREIIRLEERKNSVRKDYDNIISELWEQYNLTRTDAESLAEKITDISAAQKTLGELKNKIRGLGTVNVAAIEEYKEVSERYKFLSEQLNDVEVSKRELEKLIAELTETMRTQFAKSFDEINRNFQSIFVELFGGGKGELFLTNPDDVLESGIEIHVAPPGKVIKNLSLLSGGEQAFVAIAIYFAILKIKPAPFCILDEIEAALDDVNVTKYAQYLRNFVGTTQFILITHRRGTMEEADVLYGVTMQEKGISKLLKLDQGASFTEQE